jgi:hypothetical protein
VKALRGWGIVKVEMQVAGDFHTRGPRASARGFLLI